MQQLRDGNATRKYSILPRRCKQTGLKVHKKTHQQSKLALVGFYDGLNV